MKRMDYETLAMEEIIVDVQDGFLEASVYTKSEVKTTGHELNEVDGTLFDVSDGNNGWK